MDVKSAFRDYLNSKPSLSQIMRDGLLDMADGEIDDFIRNHIDPDFPSLYIITDAAKLMEYQSAIWNNGTLKMENIHKEPVSYTDALNYYLKFLNSKFYPSETEDGPAKVPGEEFQHVALMEFDEGEELHYDAKRYVRNKEARDEAIRHFRATHDGRLFCECCGFDFSKIYGEWGDGYIEVHHRNPVSQKGGNYKVNPHTDLAMLCSNCHSMIHRSPIEDCMSVDKLRDKIRRDE